MYATPSNDYFFNPDNWEQIYGSIDAKIWKGRCENCCKGVKDEEKVMYYADPDKSKIVWWHLKKNECERTNKLCEPRRYIPVSERGLST